MKKRLLLLTSLLSIPMCNYAMQEPEEKGLQLSIAQDVYEMLYVTGSPIMSHVSPEVAREYPEVLLAGPYEHLFSNYSMPTYSPDVFCPVDETLANRVSASPEAVSFSSSLMHDNIPVASSVQSLASSSSDRGESESLVTIFQPNSPAAISQAMAYEILLGCNAQIALHQRNIDILKERMNLTQESLNVHQEKLKDLLESRARFQH